MKKEVVFIILDQFANWESAYLAAALETDFVTNNYTISYASTDKNVKTSIGNMKVLPDLTIDAIPSSAEALVLIGANESWRTLGEEAQSKIITTVQQFKKANKVVAAICDGAYFLAVNGLLNDCKHTTNRLEEIKGVGAYTNEDNYVHTALEAVSDKKIVIAKGDSALHFAASVLRALGDIPEQGIRIFYTAHSLGFEKAMELM